MLVLLLPHGGARVPMEPEVAFQLANLGVTHVSLLRDDATTALVLEGWAFDPSGSAAQAAALLAGDPLRARSLHLLAHMSLSAEPSPAKAPAPDARRGGGLG